MGPKDEVETHKKASNRGNQYIKFKASSPAFKPLNTHPTGSTRRGDQTTAQEEGDARTTQVVYFEKSSGAYIGHQVDSCKLCIHTLWGFEQQPSSMSLLRKMTRQHGGDYTLPYIQLYYLYLLYSCNGNLCYHHRHQILCQPKPKWVCGRK